MGLKKEAASLRDESMVGNGEEQVAEHIVSGKPETEQNEL